MKKSKSGWIMWEDEDEGEEGYRWWRGGWKRDGKYWVRSEDSTDADFEYYAVCPPTAGEVRFKLLASHGSDDAIDWAITASSGLRKCAPQPEPEEQPQWWQWNDTDKQWGCCGKVGDAISAESGYDYAGQFYCTLAGTTSDRDAKRDALRAALKAASPEETER